MADRLNDKLNAMLIDAIAPPGELRTAYDQLRPTQRAFVDAYIETDDPRGAAIRAFPQLAVRPSAADPRAMEFMKQPLIQAAIAERMKEVAERSTMSAMDVLAEVVKIAKANLSDYVRITPDGEPYVDLSGVTREQMAAISEVTVEDMTEGRGEFARDIRKVKFKTHDKLGALEKLMRYHGLNGSDKVELSGPGGRPIQTQNVSVVMSVEQAAEMYANSLKD